ncbi:alpha-1,3-mannosyl-glycoprotein 4-beta-N-acetylglucosaminyltransferase B-like [Mizuhopecten yessoensis]|uniref:Alpha-1,3-mannosyl-glycoprotein 4-beta-N-acetylglucosaminyltransferase B n=1 Tax=Mizuhopecten yessoensis TaxID=6573 RepID=A0A210PEU6_MIZYE|nr:alpha-1,3-mannosyl-glycoprotein 4-beta-N-acetylglucosaminyltransferase B-like [Mizuhopecten yessoensis]XP_021343357.1 alpha-1,3-mannosyl-glycoprotein 4-beta-N-acetylglucosaminyltransferase B-like [Mizuhopecten yessoensis]OWF35009.1 Alpha-1,3-mannosyl-glycoprotein 4-beta-N-acetylglucosaminyltransferase B [Mizuhopecten yessoensis]
MVPHCFRPCKRNWIEKFFLAVVTFSFFWYIGLNDVWSQLVKSDQGQRGVLQRLQNKFSLSDLLSDQTNVPAIRLIGHPRQHNVFLTIGIPTVCREHHRYLHTTLTSIINNTALTDQERIHIVVAVSYLNETCALEVKDTIKELFNTHVDSGLVELIGIPVEAYPQIRNLRRTFNDEEYRVQWRSKQNIDYSFLMNINAYRGKYYIQLEDDVTTVQGYLQEIEKYIEETIEYWAILEFSSLGFIGKLFRSSELQKMASLLRNFYSEQPCDFLMVHFMHLMVQKGRFVKIPTLFQHHGLHSSLPNLLRNVSDKFYSMGEKTLNGDNPTANINSSLRTYGAYHPMNAYDNNEKSFFLGTDAKRW